MKKNFAFTLYNQERMISFFDQSLRELVKIWLHVRLVKKLLPRECIEFYANLAKDGCTLNARTI